MAASEARLQRLIALDRALRELQAEESTSEMVAFGAELVRQRLCLALDEAALRQEWDA